MSAPIADQSLRDHERSPKRPKSSRKTQSLRPRASLFVLILRAYWLGQRGDFRLSASTRKAFLCVQLSDGAEDGAAEEEGGGAPGVGLVREGLRGRHGRDVAGDGTDAASHGGGV